MVSVSQENGKEINLNVGLQLPDGIVGDMEDTMVGVGTQVVENGLDGGHRVLDDDPFDLATIIEAVMNEKKGKKMFLSRGGVCGACDVC